MALRYKTRRRLALLVLVLGLPAYIVGVVSLLNALDRPSLWLELLIYIAAGVLWALPLRFLFLGVGQADPGPTRRPQ